MSSLKALSWPLYSAGVLSGWTSMVFAVMKK